MDNFFRENYQKNSNKKLYNLFKLIVSVGFLWFLLEKLDTEIFIAQIQFVNIQLYLGAVILFLLGNLFAAFRWKAVLKPKQINPPIYILIKYYFIGYFFGLLLPLSIGGDIPRAFYLYKYTQKQDESISSPIIERVGGVLVMLFFGSYALFEKFSDMQNNGVKFLLVGIGFILVGGGMFFMLPDSVFFRFKSIENKLLGALLGAVRSIHSYKAYPGALLTALFLSFLFQTVNILAVYFIGIAVGLKLPLVDYFVVVPIAWFASLLPISLGGIGIREGTLSYLLVVYGSTPEQAGLTSFLYLIILLFQAGLGGILFLFQKANSSTIKAEKG